MRRSCGGESFGVGCAPDDANTSRGFRTFGLLSLDSQTPSSSTHLRRRIRAVGCCFPAVEATEQIRSQGRSFPAAASGDLVDVVGHLGEEYQEWLPVVCYVLSISARKGLTFPRIGLIVAFAVLIWTLLEYTLSSLPFPHRNQELLFSSISLINLKFFYCALW
ncbi:unnamed protein product [Brassica oleracea]